MSKEEPETSLPSYDAQKNDRHTFQQLVCSDHLEEQRSDHLNRVFHIPKSK